MNRKKWVVQSLLILFHFAGNAFCYPVGNVDDNSQTLMKNERKLPNGTVVGKYTYSDKDGNPIEVKYYADSSSYGVELNSVKVIDPEKTASTSFKGITESPEADLQKEFLYSPINTGRKLAKPINSKKNLPIVGIEVTYPTLANKYRPLDSYDYLNRDIKKNNHYKLKKQENPRPDYDIYLQNELKGDSNCHGEEVKLYFNEPNRNVRSALSDNFDADKYCEQIMT